MKRNVKNVLFLFFLVLGFALLGYLLLVFYYRQGFRLNTWINGVYCTGKTVEEVNGELLSVSKAPVIAITDDEEHTYTLDLSEADYTSDFRQPLEQYLKEQNPFLWLDGIMVHSRHVLAPAVTLDEASLQSLWDELPFVKKELKREKTLEIRLTDEGYVLYDGLKGRLDSQKAYRELISAIEDRKTSISLMETECYYDMELSGEQKKLLMLWEKIADFQDCGIIYDMGAERIPLDASIMSDFLVAQENLPVLDEAGNLVIDEARVKDFVKELASKYDTYGKERSFQSTRGDIITVKGGTYGTKLNQKAEVKYLLERAASQNEAEGNEIHVPEYEKQGFCRGSEDIGTTYIEIDMTEQKMYYYEEGELLLETEVVTGNTGRKMGTPEGVNYVYNKQRDRVLRGPGYASFVKYWMPVNGGIGIHDAGWRRKFGGEIYKNNGSHGCINTPTDIMTELYDMVEIGTPVVMFY